MNYELALDSYEFMFGHLGGGRSGVIPVQDHSRVIPGSFRGHSGIIPRSFQGYSRVIPGLAVRIQRRRRLGAGPAPAQRWHKKFTAPVPRAIRPCGGFSPLSPLEEPSSETLLGKHVLEPIHQSDKSTALR